MSERMEPGRAHRLCEYMRAQAPNASPGRADYLANVADDWERARTAEVTEKARADALEADCAAMRKTLEAATLHVYWSHITRTPAGRLVDECAKAALAPDAGKRLLEEHAAEVRAIEARLLQATMNAKKAEREHAAALAAKDGVIRDLTARIDGMRRAMNDVTGGFRG